MKSTDLLLQSEPRLGLRITAISIMSAIGLSSLLWALILPRHLVTETGITDSILLATLLTFCFSTLYQIFWEAIAGGLFKGPLGIIHDRLERLPGPWESAVGWFIALMLIISPVSYVMMVTVLIWRIVTLLTRGTRNPALV